MLNQQPNLPLQDQHEGTKIQASRKKPMQLTIREYYVCTKANTKGDTIHTIKRENYKI
jgi:hypothetical protein